MRPGRGGNRLAVEAPRVWGGGAEDLGLETSVRRPFGQKEPAWLVRCAVPSCRGTGRREERAAVMSEEYGQEC